MNENRALIPADIEQYLEQASEADAPDAAPKPEWKIADDRTAEWALRKIAEAHKECNRICELADQIIFDAEYQKKKAKNRLEADTSYLSAKLQMYFEKVPHHKTKTQESYKLLSGTIIRKLGQLKHKYDDDKLLEWLKKNKYDKYIKTKETPKWAEFKELLDLTGSVAVVKGTGEIVDVIRMEQQPHTYEIKLPSGSLIIGHINELPKKPEIDMEKSAEEFLLMLGD